MLSTNEMNKREKRKVDFSKITLLIQLILLIFVLCFGIMSLLENKFTVILYGLTAILMLVMAYNNIKIYKRKYATYAYLIIGAMLLVRIVILVFV